MVENMIEVNLKWVGYLSIIMSIEHIKSLYHNVVMHVACVTYFYRYHKPTGNVSPNQANTSEGYDGQRETFLS
jgi:hypothetical protein